MNLNWNIQKIIFKGSEEQVLKFLNDGLEAIFVTPESEINKAFHLLFTVCKNYANMGLWAPMPKTFNTDTTSYPERFHEEAEYQQKTYGVVGWRDYNIQKRLGTKWDAYFTDAELIEEEGQYTLRVNNRTFGSYPDVWLKNMSNIYGFNIYFTTHEEGSLHEGHGTIEKGQLQIKYNETSL